MIRTMGIVDKDNGPLLDPLRELSCSPWALRFVLEQLLYNFSKSDCSSWLRGEEADRAASFRNARPLIPCKGLGKSAIGLDKSQKMHTRPLLPPKELISDRKGPGIFDAVTEKVLVFSVLAHRCLVVISAGTPGPQTRVLRTNFNLAILHYLGV